MSALKPRSARPLSLLRPLLGRRELLWLLLAVLVPSLLVTLVWLAGRYEASQVQSRLEGDVLQTVGEIRVRLTRNLQSLQALQWGEAHAAQQGPARAARWAQAAAALLRQRRELLRIEWRDAQLRLKTAADTPYRSAVYQRLGRNSALAEVRLACASARRLSGPSYSGSYFVPLADGLGLQAMELCLPLASDGIASGYLVATYALQDILDELARQLTRNQVVSFTEGDGTRLAVRGNASRSERSYTAQHLLDLPGTAMVLRIDSWQTEPRLFPNVLTALVTAMSLALVCILLLLGRDMRRRLKAESALADALAFRKAMEDSLITGLRARDLQGRITYVNPAFCQMVGFEAQELLGQSTQMPYWPPEYVDEYKNRQAARLADKTPPREGRESVFMRKDGTRFAVLVIEAPLINAQGRQTGWMSAFLDLSEQRRIEELSRASQERLQATARLAMVGEMASLLSHELNQPLAAIASYATGIQNLLQQGAGATPEVEQAMQRIAEQAERAGKVIKSVHDLVRRREQARQPVSPQTLIESVLPLVNLQARKLGVQVQLELTPELPQVLCEQTMIEQVLLNLARNGMQAMQRSPAPRRLTLRVQPGAAQRVEFSVADLGPGIAPAVAEQLFTPFFTTKAEGMGLGLSLCRSVLEQHGSTLSFGPNQPQGTVFTFALAVAADSGP